MFLRKLSALALSASMIPFSVYGQTAVPDARTGTPVFQLKAQTVVVDVVVTDSKDQPIGGLHKQDFEVREAGQPQTISFFEEHTGVAPDSAPPPPHESNVFTNVAGAKTTDSVNVLLLDSLNTPLQDQSYVHNETMKYLKNVEPGTRLAIFTLGNELHFVHGFTADLFELSAALNAKSTNPRSSALLRSSAVQEGEMQQVDLGKRMVAESDKGYGPSTQLQASVAALQQFQAQTRSFELDIRVHQTLLALQQLARYLAGVPGRKNVIWFTGSIPLTIFPNGDGYNPVPTAAEHVLKTDELGEGFNATRNYDVEMRKTNALLAAAQVAVYPIAAEGTATDQYVSAEHRLSGVSSGQDASVDQVSGLRDEARSRNAGHTAMDQIAYDTGGQAFYNNNGIKSAIAHVLHNGTRYYTIAYTPTNKEMNGSYRPIKVAMTTGGGYKLAYRRGYYAVDAKREESEAKTLIKDPLHPYMGHGMPDSTQIPFTLNLVRSPAQPAADAKVAGDNAALKGPFTRYTATFWIPVTSLTLEATPDGAHQDALEATLVVYDAQGKALNWIVRMVNLSLKPERWAAAQQVGIPLRVEIDAPSGETSLRTGILENSSHTAGTLEVPLSEVTPVAVASK